MRNPSNCRQIHLQIIDKTLIGLMDLQWLAMGAQPP